MSLFLPKNSHKKHTFSDNPITGSMGAEKWSMSCEIRLSTLMGAALKLSSLVDVGAAVCILKQVAKMLQEASVFEKTNTTSCAGGKKVRNNLVLAD